MREARRRVRRLPRYGFEPRAPRGSSLPASPESRPRTLGISSHGPPQDLAILLHVVDVRRDRLGVESCAVRFPRPPSKGAKPKSATTAHPKRADTMLPSERLMRARIAWTMAIRYPDIDEPMSSSGVFRWEACPA